MKRIVPAALIVLLNAFIFAPVAAGWGGTGHQVVALIAEDLLDAPAQKCIRELLGDAHISDAEIANWADEIRRERRETGPWHYVNIPVDATGFDRARDGRDGNNVVDAIERQLKILADRSAPIDQRREALKFVVHFVGDMHQPLHCADRNGDKGGNARLVFFPNQAKATSLHSIWDTQIVKEAMKSVRVAPYAETLRKQIATAQRADWEKGSVAEWATQSHDVAVKSVYAMSNRGRELRRNSFNERACD
jgi:hypothetical protein